mgnify:CR=1 FL=1
MQKNSPPRRKLWQRLLSVLMTLALIVTSIVGFQQSKETVKAEDLRMSLDDNGNIRLAGNASIAWDSITGTENVVVK